MNDTAKFQRFAAITALIAFPLMIAQGLTSLAAVNYDGSAWSNPSTIIALGPSAAKMLRWSMILDVFGDYLLLIPLMLYLRMWLKPHSPNFVTFFTLCGLGYPLLGSIGAIVLAAVLPPLITQYAQAASQQQVALQAVFDGFINAVYLGLWNPLETFLFGIWFVGIGTILQKERRALGMIACILGGFTLLGSVGRFLDVNALFLVGASGMLVFFPIWLPWIAIDMLRSPKRRIEQLDLSVAE